MRGGAREVGDGVLMRRGGEEERKRERRGFRGSNRGRMQDDA